MSTMLDSFKGSAPPPVIDFGEDIVVTEAALSAVSVKAFQLIEAQLDVQSYEQKLAETKERVRRLEEVELPEAMDNAKMTEFKLTNGKMVKVKQVIAGSPPKDRLPEALAWFRGHGHDGIIKRSITLTVSLPKGQDKEGNKLVKYLRRLKTLQSLGVFPKDEPSVHYQTFGSWARELHEIHLEEHLASATVDEHCPFCKDEYIKLLGIYIGRKAEIKDVKK